VGEISAVRVSYPNDRPRNSRSRGSTGCTGLRRGRRTRAFLQVKDSQIAEQVAGTLALQPEVTDTDVVHDYVLQNNLSDIDFLAERARRIRYEVVVTIARSSSAPYRTIWPRPSRSSTCAT